MKLLFITRKIDKKDPKAGFVFDWVCELASKVETLYVICWHKSVKEGLPENVLLLNLPKDKISKVVMMQFALLGVIRRVDGVFTHMMPVYAILAGPVCRLYKKRLIHWYTHKNVDLKLKIANLFVNGFITASKESFRFKTKKMIHVFGHGINMHKMDSFEKEISNNEKYKIITVGRVSPAKNIDLIIKAVEVLNEDLLKDKVELNIIGGPGLKSQKEYFNNLIKYVEDKGLGDIVKFLGEMEHDKVLKQVASSDLFINLSDTGSVDKAVLEPMALKCLVISSNEAFKEILPGELYLGEKSLNSLVVRVFDIYNMPEETKDELRKSNYIQVVENNNLDNLMKKIVGLYE